MIQVLTIGDRVLSVQYHHERPCNSSRTDPGCPGVEIDGVWEGLEVAETTAEENEEIEHELSKIPTYDDD